MGIHPIEREALYRFVNLLLNSNRVDDARLLAETTLKLDPKNGQVKGLIENLKNFKPKQ